MSATNFIQPRCQACGAVVHASDNFCAKCGSVIRENVHPLHERMSAIERLAFKIAAGTLLLILLSGWILLQLYHFGRGGALG